MESPKKNFNEIQAELQGSAQEAEWSWFAAHLARGAVIHVSPELSLAEVGAHIATDSVEHISGWLSSRAIFKPGSTEIAQWDSQPSQRFRFIIVQPYVLIQAISQ